MPGGGGGRAAEEIRNRHPEVAIIALTGMDPLEASHAMMSAGAVGFPRSMQDKLGTGYGTAVKIVPPGEG